jgi:hypothetical protein
VNDLEIKDAVRARDGHKCRDCGMTSEEHVAKYGRELDVHRLLPGSVYEVDWAVTLCRACHGDKPRTVSDAYFWGRERTGIHFAHWNMYDPDDADLMRRLDHLAEEQGLDAEALLNRILREYCHGAPLNYCI